MTAPAWSTAKNRTPVNSTLVTNAAGMLQVKHSGSGGATNTDGPWPKGNEMSLATASGSSDHATEVPHLQHIRAIGPNLRAARSKLGLTQGQLAERAGLSLGWISAVETGRRVPCVENLVRICLAVGVGVDVALGMGGGR